MATFIQYPFKLNAFYTRMFANMKQETLQYS